MDDYIFNIGPILFCLIIFAIIILLGVIAFLFHNFKGLNLFSKHDNSIIDKFLSKYPNVSIDFIKKDIKAQSIENNQEIHELNKRVERIEQYVEELNNKIEKQLDKIIEEIPKRG